MENAGKYRRVVRITGALPALTPCDVGVGVGVSGETPRRMHANIHVAATQTIGARKIGRDGV